MYASCGLYLPVDWVPPAWPLFDILYRLQFMYDTVGALVLIVSGWLIPRFVCSALIWAFWAFMPWLVFWLYEPFYAVMLPKFCRNLQAAIVCLFVPLIGSLHLATFALEWEICWHYLRLMVFWSIYHFTAVMLPNFVWVCRRFHTWFLAASYSCIELVVAVIFSRVGECA